MCGRFTLRARLTDLAAEFDLKWALEQDWTPNSDIRPTTQIPIIRQINGERELAMVRWGLVPPWEPEPKTKYSTFNAKAETVSEKASYKKPFQKQRCLIVADGYDEWKVVGGTEKKPIKQRYHIHCPDDRFFAFAGLWEHWEREENAVDSATIIITSGNAELSHIHERMPVILHKQDFPLWLDPEFEGKERLLSLLQPYEAGELVATAI